jgi:hypothetical protein
MTGSMKLVNSRYNVNIVAINDQGAHPHSPNAYNAVVEALSKEKSSPSPIEGHISFLTAWIAAYNEKKPSSVQLDSFLNPVNKTPDKTPPSASKREIPQVDSLKFGTMRKSGPAVGIGFVRAAGSSTTNPTPIPK